MSCVAFAAGPLSALEPPRSWSRCVSGKARAAELPRVRLVELFGLQRGAPADARPEPLVQEVADRGVDVAHDHEAERTETMQPLVALVHLSDLLCRMRDLGHGHYERQKVDLIADPAWGVLVKEHRELASMDLVRFTFELDDAVEEIRATVATIFGPARSMARS